MARYCFQCGSVLAEDSEFCHKCGTPVTAYAKVIRCPGCGALLKNHKCEYCGFEETVSFAPAVPAVQKESPAPAVKPAYVPTSSSSSDGVGSLVILLVLVVTVLLIALWLVSTVGSSDSSSVGTAPSVSSSGSRGVTYSGSWGDAVTIYGGANSYTTLNPYVFDSTIKNCRSFKIDLSVQEYKGYYPSGAWKVYARNIKGQWINIGTIEVPSGNGKKTVTTTISAEKCATFDAIAITMPNSGCTFSQTEADYYDFRF